MISALAEMTQSETFCRCGHKPRFLAEAVGQAVPEELARGNERAHSRKLHRYLTELADFSVRRT